MDQDLDPYFVIEGFRRSIEDFQTEYHRLISELPPVMTSAAFGGWSITSSTGDYKDGWHEGHLRYEVEPLISHKPIGTDRYNTKTTLYRGCVAELFSSVHSAGLNPTRIRWTLLKARSSGSLHRDAPDDRPAYRLHLPVITNSECRFNAAGKSGHAPADGRLYGVRVNQMHQIVNRSDYDRVHIIADIDWDQNS